MVVMSQLYLCDEPYWSRFHVTEPPPTPSIHVISDGKTVNMCLSAGLQPLSQSPLSLL